MDTITIRPNDRVRRGDTWYTVNTIVEQGVFAYAGLDARLDELIRFEAIAEHIQTSSTPQWRVRLMQVHEHETVPTTKTGKVAAAVMIRKALKQVFPGCTFSVTSSRGSAVRIAWTDGPTTKMVEHVANRHEMGHFDGQVDCYDYSNRRDDIPQTNYVFCHRGYSPAAFQNALDHINARFGYELRMILSDYQGTPYVDRDSDKHTGHDYQSHDLHNFIYDRSLICPACDWHTMPADTFCEQCGACLGETA